MSVDWCLTGSGRHVASCGTITSEVFGCMKQAMLYAQTLTVLAVLSAKTQECHAQKARGHNCRRCLI